MGWPAENNELNDAVLDRTGPPVVVVGAGPVGIRVAQELVRRKPDCPVVLYGEESWEPYNRVRLSSFLAGELKWTALANDLMVPEPGRVVRRYACKVVRIDRAARVVFDADGRRQPYSRLVLAVGSRPHVPNIPGIDRHGVFTFRDLDDTQRLFARRIRSRRTLILGGGVLGLEVARAMQRAHTEVTVIDHASRLMYRQLDDRAAGLLREHVLGLGIWVILADGVKEILGEDAVSGVRLQSGRVIDCDTIVLATGIRPRLDLARTAKLGIGRGIRVNDRMQTSDPDIYAVGECAEHRDRIYGLVAPGLEQAAVAAHSVLDGDSSYTGSLAATRLKVVGRPLFSMGRVGEEEDASRYRYIHFKHSTDGLYRKLVLHKGRLVGAIALGDWRELGRVQEAIGRGRRLGPWQLARFHRSGALWPMQDVVRVAAWPAATTVCNCVGVSRGTLSQAVSAGCTTVEALAARTCASTVCGSCRPLLAELVGTPIGDQPLRTYTGLLTVSLLAGMTTLMILSLPAAPISKTVQAWRFDVLWIDGFWKQTTGFGLLGLSLVGLLLSPRKRWKRFSLGKFSAWRLLHAAAGVSASTLLFFHTGLRLGTNLNLALMATYLVLALLGAVAGGVTALEGRIGGALARRLRSGWNWAHIALFWPLPALLGFHVLSVYYF